VPQQSTPYILYDGKEYFIFFTLLYFASAPLCWKILWLAPTSLEIVPDRSCLSCGKKQTLLLEDVVGASLTSPRYHAEQVYNLNEVHFRYMGAVQNGPKITYAN
jgi:hypothetical protein